MPTWTEPANNLTSGPYRLEEWTHDEHIMLTRNPTYFGADDVQIERVRMWMILEASTAWQMYLNGELDTTGPPRGFAFAGRAFDLYALRQEETVPSFEFERPVTISVKYTDRHVGTISQEDQLALHWWDGSAWQDAAHTCSPAGPYVRDLSNNVFTLTICHLSRFAVFGPTNELYLPFVLRIE